MRLIDSVFFKTDSVFYRWFINPYCFYFRRQLRRQNVWTKTVGPVHGIIWAEPSILQTDINFRTTFRLHQCKMGVTGLHVSHTRVLALIIVLLWRVYLSVNASSDKILWAVLWKFRLTVVVVLQNASFSWVFVLSLALMGGIVWRRQDSFNLFLFLCEGFFSAFKFNLWKAFLS